MWAAPRIDAGFFRLRQNESSVRDASKIIEEREVAKGQRHEDRRQGPWDFRKIKKRSAECHRSHEPYQRTCFSPRKTCAGETRQSLSHAAWKRADPFSHADRFRETSDGGERELPRALRDID